MTPTQTLRTTETIALLIPNLEQAIETFIRLELSTNERSAQTIRWYRERLEMMSQFLGKERSPNAILDVDLLDWLASLKERPMRYGGKSSRPSQQGSLSPFTLRGHVRAMRRFWRWLHKKGFIDADPAIELPMPKKPKIAKRGIAENDQQAILDAARPPDLAGMDSVTRQVLTKIRDYAILQFLDATGCRLGGLSHLLLADLRLDDPNPRIARRVLVIEKGEKERYVFLSPAAFQSLRQWLLVRPPCPDSNVFVGCANGKTDWHALHEGGIYEIVKRYAKIAGVKKPGALWSPHQWRHRFGRRWLERGGDLSRLAQLMGHTTVQITAEHYGQFEIDALQDGYEDVLGED